jgi:hypothetical protein
VRDYTVLAAEGSAVTEPAGPRRKVHGRRKGKALRATQRRNLEALLPRLAVPGVAARRGGGGSTSPASFPRRRRSGSRSASVAASISTPSPWSIPRSG